MTRIYVPSSGVEDWRQLLANPQKHWQVGYSARTLAHAWESSNGFPPEVSSLLTCKSSPFSKVELLAAIPEHKVRMPPYSGHPSQNDLFVLAKDENEGLIALTIEGKVSESFDQTLAEWNVKNSSGKEERLAYIQEILGIDGNLPPTTRYQLLHRMASAVIEANRFTAQYAVMVIHSFSQSDLWFGDFCSFLSVFGVKNAEIGELYFLGENLGINLYAGWARGDAQFLEM